MKVVKELHIFEESITDNSSSRINTVRIGADVVYEFPVEVITTDRVTANGNKYPYDVVKNGLENDLRISRALSNGGLPSEPNHYIPKNSLKDPADFKRYIRVNMDTVSHMITKFYWEDRTLFAMVRTLVGSKINNLIASGFRPAFSLRSLAHPQMDNGVKVAKSFKLISLDWVDVNSNDGSIPDQNKMINISTTIKPLASLSVANGGFTESIDVMGEDMNAGVFGEGGNLIGVAQITTTSQTDRAKLKSRLMDIL